MNGSALVLRLNAPEQQVVGALHFGTHPFESLVFGLNLCVPIVLVIVTTSLNTIYTDEI